MSFPQIRVDKNQEWSRGLFLPLADYIENRMVMKNFMLAIFLPLLWSTVTKAQMQPANAGFEDWENVLVNNFFNIEEPVDWNTSTSCTAILNIAPVRKDSDAHSGTYSAKLVTLDAVPGVKANGVLTTAEILCTGQGGGQQGGVSYIEEFPDSLVGWYKYAPANNDSAYAQIMFLANGDQDTVCFTRLDLFEQSEWTRFAVALCPNATGSGEKLSLFFSSSWGDGGLGQAEVGSTLFLDDIAFVNGQVSVDEVKSNYSWNVYPNPTQGELNIQTNFEESTVIEFIDATGKIIMNSNLNETNSTLDLSAFRAGLYLYQIRTVENQVLRTGRLVINQ